MARTQYGVSPWIEGVPARRRPACPRFRGEASYPVVIVGGGLAGVFTAYAFSAAGIRVALLEADRLGYRGAGRGPGILQGEPAASFRDIEARHGRRAARALFELSRRAVLDLASTARRLGVRQIATGDAVRVVASYAADDKAFAREIAARRAAGLGAVWLDGARAARESRVELARAGVRLHDWGEADPYRLLVAFAAAASSRGAALFERSAVRRITAQRRGVAIRAEGGMLTAETVVICTGEPTELFRPLQRHVRAMERYVVLTDRIPASIRKQIATETRVVADVEVPPHLVRWTEDGRLIVAGADQARPSSRGKDKILVQRTGQLMYELTRLYPAVSGIPPVRGWDLPVAATADGVMYAGPHRNYPRHLFAWATDHDPAQAFLASRILLRAYLGQPDRRDRYFAFTRG